MSKSLAGKLNKSKMDGSHSSNDIRTAPSSEGDVQIKLRVGEREFVTSRETLQESGCFSSLLARWEYNALLDGSYFIDGDGNLFEQVLRYLRPGVLPLFYSKEKGHDYAMYGAILQEARYYQIDRLRKWIEEKKYLEAVRLEVTTSVHGHTDSFGSSGVLKERMELGTEIQQTCKWTSTKRFHCPRIPSSQITCDDVCFAEDSGNKLHGTESETETFPSLKVVQVKKEIVFNHEVCLE